MNILKYTEISNSYRFGHPSFRRPLSAQSGHSPADQEDCQNSLHWYLLNSAAFVRYRPTGDIRALRVSGNFTAQNGELRH
jgi:hypothetical protein